MGRPSTPKGKAGYTPKGRNAGKKRKKSDIWIR